MIDLILNYEFIRNALIVAVLASIVGGVIGTIVVEKRLVSMAGGLAHGAFGGIGLGFLIGVEPILIGLLFTIFASLFVGKINRMKSEISDTVISIIWSLGMALGVLFIFLAPGYPPDMSSYLFGDILTVSRQYVYMILILAIIISVLVYLLFNYFKLYLFDEQYASIIGINTHLIENILYIMIGVTVVIMIKSVGIILCIALLTLPAITAKHFSSTLSTIMFLAIAFSIVYSFTGIYFSYKLNIPSGTTIILTSAIFYAIITFFIRFLVKKPKNII